MCTHICLRKSLVNRYLFYALFTILKGLYVQSCYYNIIITRPNQDNFSTYKSQISHGRMRYLCNVFYVLAIRLIENCAWIFTPNFDTIVLASPPLPLIVMVHSTPYRMEETMRELIRYQVYIFLETFSISVSQQPLGGSPQGLLCTVFRTPIIIT